MVTKWTKTVNALLGNDRFTGIFLFILALIGHDNQAQTTFRYLNTSNGLAHNTVMNLIQDHRGFLWIGTADGLNRYDGERFQTYRRSARDTSSLSNNYINCLLEDRQHRLWVGTNFGGINQLDSSGARFVHLNRATNGVDLSTVTITDLVQDHRGFIWASTNGNGLLQIDPNTRRVRQLSAENAGLPSNFIRQLCADRQGNLWTGNQYGMLTQMRLTDHRMTPVILPGPATHSPKSIMTIQCDSRGRVWVGTQGSGLFRAEPGQTAFRSVFFRPGVVEGVNDARSLYEDKNGRFWLGTDDGLVVANDPDFRQTTHLPHNPALTGSLSTHATVCVRGDRQGNTWVGTWEGGLNVCFAQPDLFGLHTRRPGQPNSLLAQAVSAVAADSAGNAWVGSTQGLTYINRKTDTYRHFRHQPGNPRSLPGNDVTHLYLLSEKVLLVTLWNVGTVLVIPQTGQVQQRIASLGWEPVYPVMPMTGRSIRVITRRGDSWLIDRQTGQVSPAERLSEVSSSLRLLCQTTDGTLWGGTYGNGLIEWPGQKSAAKPVPHRRTGRSNGPTEPVRRSDGPTRFYYSERKPGFLYDDNITCLFEDRQKQLWVGTLNGLHRYDRRTRRFTLLATDNGLTNDAIMSIGQDSVGLLWVATNDGLCQVSEAGQVVRTYRREDGLAGNDFAERAVSKSPDGTLFWGGKHGLTVFRPNQTSPAEPVVPVYITDLKLFNRPVLPGGADSPLTRALTDTKALTFRYNQSVITLDFAAVLFRAHRNVRYAYKLDGFEEAWNYVGAQHSATYTNQNPGTYQFRVKASLSDDFRNAPETVLELTILPPWYRTSWAYCLYAALIVGLLLFMRWLIQIREGFKTELRA